MVTTYLPLFANNLPPVIGSHHLWAAIWCISLVGFYPRVLSNKVMLYTLFYGLLIFIAIKTIWVGIDSWNYKLLLGEFYNIVIGVSVITYFTQSGDYRNLARLTKWSIVFILITALMSIISSAIDPMYARNLGGLSERSETEQLAILSLTRLGGGTYSTAAVFMSLFPLWIYYYKNNDISLLSKKLIIITALTIIFALFGMQIFANIIIAFVFGVLSIFGMRRIKTSILIVFLFLSIITFIPKDTYVNTLFQISRLFENKSELNYKFNDLSLFIEEGAEIEGSKTSAAVRAQRYPLLFDTFLKSPILGCYYFTDSSGNNYRAEGAHIHWMNKLTVTGIIGLILFMFIPYLHFKSKLKFFHSEFKFYYILSSLSIIALGLFKTLVGRETWYAFFVIIPGSYYLHLLKSGRNKSSRKTNFPKRIQIENNTLNELPI